MYSTMLLLSRYFLHPPVLRDDHKIPKYVFKIIFSGVNPLYFNVIVQIVWGHSTQIWKIRWMTKHSVLKARLEVKT